MPPADQPQFPLSIINIPLRLTLSTLDLSFIFFLAGYAAHQTFKSTHYPTVATLTSLASYVLSLVAAIGCLSACISIFSPLKTLLLYSTLSFSISSGFLASLLFNRIFISPLRSFPGPTVAKITKLWGLWNARNGEYHWKVKEVFDKYAVNGEDWVRIGPNEVSTRDVEVVKEIFGRDGWDKGPWYDGGSKFEGQDSLFHTRSHETHLKRRKIWDQGFTPASLRHYSTLLIPRVSQLLSLVASSSPHPTSQPFDITKSIAYFAFDFMGDIAFGGGFELMRYGDREGYWEAMEKNMRFIGVTGHISEIAPTIRKYLPLPFATTAKNFVLFCAQKLAERRVNGSRRNQKDLFYYIIGEGEDSEAMKRREVQVNNGMLMSDSLLVIIAGSDTTSNTLAIILYLLLTHPKILDTLSKEIDAAFEELESDDEVLPFDLLGGQLEYLEAVISESMRLFPVVPSGSYRWSGNEGKVVAGRYIPPRTTVSLNTYTIHRDSRYFGPDPLNFRPERWISGEPINRSAFLPFSTGPYNCVGKQLALMEMRAVLSGLLRRFEFKLEKDFDQEKWERGTKSFFVMVKDPLRVFARDRRYQTV